MPHHPSLAFFLPALNAGGAERVMLAVSGEIAKRGIRCELVTAQAGGAWQDRVPDGVRHVCLDSGKPLRAVPRLVRYLRASRPDALLASVFSANIAALMATAATGTRCVLREASKAEYDAMSSSRLGSLANRAALRWLYRRADAVVALTDGLAAHIVEASGISQNKVHVIPNPHLPRVDEDVEKRDAELVLACGRLEKQKDFETLLRAFAQVRKTRPSRLVLLGEGSQRQALAALAADLGIERSFLLAGHSNQVSRWMRRAKVMVSTSRVEGFPNVLLEALAAGCAIVSTESSDAVHKLLDDERLGAIVPVGDESRIAQAILAALASEAAPECVDLDSHYDLSVIVDDYLKVLDPDTYGSRTASDEVAAARDVG